uniref:Retrovirus-related Pol polyprotein from transposon TNT 1-94 n=1 Tax=Tanacetum cinerariifolium TaxID=118510 RepID=A0A699GNC8_TANCI|nr:hypothetical protein [Tanacetum cinerariifolium]
MTQVKVLMDLADDELVVAKNGEWIDITMRKVNIILSMDEDADWKTYLKNDLLVFKQAKLKVVTFQLQNTKIIKQNYTLQEIIISLIHVESPKSPTAVLFDVDTGRISIVTVNTKEYHSDVLAKSQG